MQVVIDIPKDMYDEIKSGKDGYSNYVHNSIRNGTPQPKTGKWMETDSADPYWYMCSECHRRLFEQEAYCPSCGAKMK